ncbi:hypothetical protein [Flavobacterium sp.]|nr:hypothetical protein [Flavobacterium sp.]
METIKVIKTGPKRQTSKGKDDKRQRVTPDNKPKHPTLKPHKHKRND